MPYRSYSTGSQWPGILTTNYSNTWENSARDSKGQLILVDHAHDYYNSRMTSAFAGPDGRNFATGAEDPVIYIAQSSDINELHARLMGKLRAGNASLGVTLGSMNQSMAMIVNRFDDINRVMGLAIRRRNRQRLNRRATGRRQLASSVLEVEFGWRPFIEDIFNALSVITTMNDELIRVRVAKRISVNTSSDVDGIPRTHTSITGTARLTATGTYRVSNPNIWLANRLGLLNPFAVAWDLVPWSWVVGMFVNANQLISSLTDTMGLTRVSGSLTVSSRLLRERTVDWYPYPWVGMSGTNVLTRYRNRGGLSALRPSLEFRLPKFNLELGVIASALAVQRSTTLSGRN